MPERRRRYRNQTDNTNDTSEETCQEYDAAE
ncbi:MAG: hypothetical protein JWQ49_596 [Edaphobacter sp.]|nr:hypothetical protein [Edaphobacter sp.]